MQISLSKKSDVPLRQQLAEQIVCLITTGQLRAGEQLPSVRALARRVKVHHNTVSEAYQDLVRRNWLTRQRGSRLIVGAHSGSSQQSPSSLDELINESIQRAKQMGYSLQALTECVRERLLAQPPDHFLIVEQEPGLREIIRQRFRKNLICPWRAALRNSLQGNHAWRSALKFSPQITSSKSWRRSCRRIDPASRLLTPVQTSMSI